MKFFMALALLAAVWLPAEAGKLRMHTGTWVLSGGGGGGIATLEPSAGWNGTASTCSPASATVRGSGSIEPPIAGFDQPDNDIVEDNANYIIAVGAATSNRGWISSVDFILEGNTVNVPDPSENAFHSPSTFGWAVKIRSRQGGAGVGKNGDATLCAYIHPVNGVDRLLSIPLWLNSNSSGDSYVDRMSATNARYVDVATGSNPANCTGSGTTNGTQSAPYASIAFGLGCGVDGGVTFVRPGTYVEAGGCPGGICGAYTRYNSVRGCGGADWTGNACAAGWNAGHRVRYNITRGGARAIWTVNYANMIELYGADVDVSNVNTTTVSNLLLNNVTWNDLLNGSDNAGGLGTVAQNNDIGGWPSTIPATPVVQVEESSSNMMMGFQNQFVRNVTSYASYDVFNRYNPPNLAASSWRTFNYTANDLLRLPFYTATGATVPFTVESAVFNVPAAGQSMVHFSDVGLTIANGLTLQRLRLFNGPLAWTDWVTLTTTNSYGTYATISNAVNAGGLCKITVNSAFNRAAGQQIVVKGISGATGCNGTWIINAVSGNDITLGGTTFGGSYSSGGSIDAMVMVTGDVSTAGAGTKAALLNDFFHADCNQFQISTSAGYANYDNTYHQNYKCIGYQIQGFLPQEGSWTLPGTINTSGTTLTFVPTSITTISSATFSSPNTTINFTSGTVRLPTILVGSNGPGWGITVTAGTHTGQFTIVSSADSAGVSSVVVSGDASGATALTFDLIAQPGDFIRKTSGAADGRAVVSVNSATQATMADAYSANDSGNTANLVKTNDGFACVACVFIITGGLIESSQLSQGVKNWALIQNTIIGNTSMQHRFDLNGVFKDYTIFDSIVQDITTSPFAAAWPFGISWDTNQILNTPSGTCSTVSACGTNMTIQSQTFAAGIVPTLLPLAANTGNGTVTGISAGAATQYVGYRISLTSATTFRVDAPDDTVVGTGTVGTPFTSSQINFTVTAGGTPFVSGDRFVLVTQGTFKPTGAAPVTAAGMVGNNHKANGSPLWPWYQDGTARAAGAKVGAQAP